MIAPSKIRCRVIAVPVARTPWLHRGLIRPSDLVPWADPYIAELIAKLQDEVRGAPRVEWQTGQDDSEFIGFELESFDCEALESRDWLANEAELPWNDEPTEYETLDDDPPPS